MGTSQKKKSKVCCCKFQPHLPILQLLSTPHYSPKLKKEVLKHCSNDCIYKICEIVYNLLKGNVLLNSSQVKKELEEQVIKSVSNKMQKKAGLLLDHLKKTKVLKWNSDGEIRYRGKLIPQSNIVDLVTNTMKTRSRKGISPPIGTD